jgi:uncharacterized cofD-like protein
MKIVVFGGGTGLSILLRGLKNYTKDISAIVTVADNGGGSGVLREDLGMLPPGDMRNCIIALADIEPVMVSLMQHRFSEGYLKGQSFGNLLIAAMYEIFGNYEHALKEIGSIFRLSGKVLPMTLEDTQLKASLDNGDCILGEKYIPEYVSKSNTKIDKISLVPEICKPLEETVRDIKEADVVVIGPGSLYTSVIPNMLVEGIPSLLKESKAPVFYVCNLMTQPGETDNYEVAGIVMNEALKSTGSIDAGQVSQVCPMIHPYFDVTNDPSIAGHTRELGESTLTDYAKDQMKNTIAALVLTAAKVIQDPKLYEEIKYEFDHTEK